MYCFTPQNFCAETNQIFMDYSHFLGVIKAIYRQGHYGNVFVMKSIGHLIYFPVERASVYLVS